MKIITEVSKCSGCGACEQICPINCITMVADGEGFLRPVIDNEKCVDCNKCRKICPVENPYVDDGKKPITIGAKNKDEGVRLSSSSGGVFSALAERIIDMGGVVFGVGFDEELNVIHKYTERKAGIEEFRGSKYVQSRIGNCYMKVKEFLEAGRNVLFTGTPCQIGGLYAYLGKNYDNLYTQDFICHGVPSPRVWSKYIKYREKRAKSHAQKVFFRNKKYGWKLYSMKLEFENSTEYVMTLSDDVYMQGFLSDLYLRPSCHECSFKKIHRCSDITIADFWGIDRVNAEFNDDKGASLLLIQTEKGKKLWEDIAEKFEVFEMAFDEAIKSNPSYLKSVSKPKLRKSFFKRLEKKPIDKLILSYCGKGYTAKLRRFLSGFLIKGVK